MAKRVNQIIEEQINFWAINQSKQKSFVQKNQRFPIITVSREFGARGAEIATILGEKLGFKVWDKELFEVISQKLGSSTELAAFLDENRRNAIEDAFFGFMNHKVTNLNYLLYLIKAVNSIENHGNSIIVGRGANFICQQNDSFHVRIVCPVKERISNLSKRRDISLEEALSIVHQKDAERSKFVMVNFSHDISTASDYDLILNSKTFTTNQIAKLIIEAYEKKIGQEALALETH